MGIRRRVRKVIAWCLFLLVTILIGGGLCAYFYVMDSDNLVAVIKREAPRFLPDSQLSLAKVRIRPLMGEITLTHTTIKRHTGTANPTLVGMSPWVQIKYDPWAAMTEGKFVPRKVVVAQPLLRLRPRQDGSWNIVGLLADPLPIPLGGTTPPIEVSNGTLELAAPGDGPGTALLRDVSIRIPAGTGGPVVFELTARGDLLDRVALEGVFEPKTGRVSISKGDLSRLSLSGVLRDRLPGRSRQLLEIAGLEGGELDVSLARFNYDPTVQPPLSYEASARLRKGIWKCPKLPFPVSDVSVDLTARDGVMRIVHAEGKDGTTTVDLSGQFGLADPMTAPFQVRAEVRNLEMDRRLRDWTPGKFADLWDVYFPKVGRKPSTSAGKVDVVVVASRAAVGAEIKSVVEASCQDVSMEYVHFKYPLDHVRGTMRIEGKLMTIDAVAPVGGRPLVVKGTVYDPGPDAVAKLAFDIESLPVDAALLNALPPDVRKVVNEFKPDGSARGHATLTRQPPLSPTDDPIGRVAFDAWVDLNPGCSITWKGFQYPIRNLTGKLEVHPNQWIFSDMHGSNGQASISAKGRVDQVGKDKFKVRTRVESRNLPFDQQLLDALPPPLQLTWATLNPTGSSDIDADIDAEPGRPDHYRVQITPKKGSGVKLQFDRPASAAGDGGGPTRIEMRMDEVSGKFVLDTAKFPPTEMEDVGFVFLGAPVRFDRGQVNVQDNGQFDLGVAGLEVKELRLDERLRRQMPPIMAQMARRLHDKSIPFIKGDLGLGWSGKSDDSAWCRWKNTLVVLNNNEVDLGTDFTLNHIQGQIEQVEGWANGSDLEVHGLLALDSLSFLGQQLTRLKARVDVAKGWASLADVQGGLLGGSFTGSLRSSLDTTPKYEAGLSIKDADLRDYAKTVPGHQTYRGLVTGWAKIDGQGFDPHAIQAQGQAKLNNGELGAVPPLLAPFFKLVSLGKDSRTAFDEAEVSFKTQNGQTSLNPVRILGNAVTLHGEGKLDVQGNLDLHLPITPGRDTWRGPIVDGFRKAGGKFLAIRVQGPLRSPNFSLDPVSIAGDSVRAISRKEGEAKSEPARR